MEKLILRVSGVLGLLFACSSLSGCITTSGAAFGAGSGAMAARGVGNDFKYYVFDAPPQIIYRIDDHRFFTLENYKDCDHGGLAYYHDTRKKIKKYVGGGSDSNSILKPNPLMSWKGQFIYAASDKVFSYIYRRPLMSDRDKSSGTFFAYEIGGRYGEIKVGVDTDPGSNTILIVTDDKLLIKKGTARGLSFDYAKKYEGGSDYHIIENKSWPSLNTPSGDKYVTCNYAIKPTKKNVIHTQVYSSDATEVPEHGK